MATALGLLAVVALILANAYFVAAEFAFVAVRRGRLEESAASGDKGATRALHVLRNLSFVLSGAQLGITVTSLVVGFIAEPTLGRALQPLFTLAGLPDEAAVAVSFTTAFVLATGAQMVFGELAPKNLAIAKPEAFARALAGSTWVYTRAAGPVIRLFDSAANRLLRVAGIEPVEELASGVSPEELQVIVEQSEESGALAPTQATLLARALEFRALRAADAMLPRNRVVTIAGDATCEDLQRLAVRTGHSRFPVVDEGLDDVKGIVQAKDVLRIKPEGRPSTPVRALLKPVLAVPESTLLAPLLADMRSSHRQLALVIDEYGGTAGIVTLEDIVEELVGSIEDEYDRAGPKVQRLPGTQGFSVPGSLRLDEVERETGIELPEGPYDTVGGLVMERLGRVPDEGDEVALPAARLRVQAVDGFAVARVLLVGQDATP